MPSQDFQQHLIAIMPKMRLWALALTRNANAADDLVQDVAVKALAASDSFEQGTNFSAWIHRIMINHFITGVRRQREHSNLDVVETFTVNAAHEDKIALRELSWKFDRLPADQKEALSLIALNEESYENAAQITRCAIGTLKSRVHRARLQLRTYMDANSKEAA